MDYTAQLENLSRRAAYALAIASAAIGEDRRTVQVRIEQARSDVELALSDARLVLEDVSQGAHGHWARLKADAGDRLAELRAQLDERRRGLDTRAACDEADWSEADAFDAIDYAEWAVDNARLAVLDAIDARRLADELAPSTTTSYPQG